MWSVVPGAVIRDTNAVCARIIVMLEAGAIITAQGTHLPARIDTICLRGDTAGAVSLARALHSAIKAKDIRLQAFEGLRS